MDDITAGTPRVLRQCASVLSTPTHEKYVDTPDFSKYASHPDIQFFRSVKAKNHYQYHRFKRSSQPLRERIYAAASRFDPYSRPQLLERLASFTALNWNLPVTKDRQLTALKCAQNGWKCMSVRANMPRNRLVCETCHQQLVLRYNDLLESDFNYDYDDIAILNDHLVTVYIEQVTTKAHGAACPWGTLETPLEGVYYMRPHLVSTNEVLLSEYRRCLNGLLKHWRILEHQLSVLLSLLNDIDHMFVKLSSEYILATESDNKENIATLTAAAPLWVYTIAQLGWELRSQQFASQTVYLMVCTGCNSRWVFNDMTAELPNLSPSKVLTPCEHKAVVEEDDGFDPWDHQPWCCRFQDAKHLLELLKRGYKRHDETITRPRKAARISI